MGKRRVFERPIISQEELGNIISKENIPLRSKALISFIYLTASRLSEAIEIEKEQIVREYPHYIVYGMKVLKRSGNHTRPAIIRISEENKPFLSYIFNYINQEGHTSPYLFPSARGGHIKARWARRIVSKVYAWPHFLRHLRCSHMAQKGLTGFQLQSFIGWAKLDTAESYVRLAAQDLRKVI